MNVQKYHFSFAQPPTALKLLRNSKLVLNPRRKLQTIPKRNRRVELRNTHRNLNRTFTCCTENSEPVEDGVILPQPSSEAALENETNWLSTQLKEWLDNEWLQSEPVQIHEQIAHRTSQIYMRQRMEGEHDLTSVMLAIGSGLEGMNFSEAFVGPWNVANRAAELLLEHHVGEQIAINSDSAYQYPSSSLDPNHIHQWREKKENDSSKDTVKDPWVSTDRKLQSGAVSPSLGDAFERYKFLKDVLDGTASSDVINGAVACAIGYRYDMQTGKWDGSDVEDENFKAFGNDPPDILGDEFQEDTPQILNYLKSQLRLEDEEIAEGLQMIIETVHGTELTRLQSNDENDHSFRKRCLVAKWLHLCGGF